MHFTPLASPWIPYFLQDLKISLSDDSFLHNRVSSDLAHPRSGQSARLNPEHGPIFFFLYLVPCARMCLHVTVTPWAANPSLLQHLFEQYFGKALDGSGQPLWAPDFSDKAVCRDLAGYWLSVHTHHSAVGVLLKHCLFMSDISKFRSRSPAPPAWVYTSTSAWSPYRCEGLSSPWRAIV